jgi:transglutaminase-like putative cysteine protease
MRRKVLSLLAALLLFAAPLFAYQDVLRVDGPIGSAQELSGLLGTAFESVSSELYFTVDGSRPWFDSALMDAEISKAAWSSPSGGLFYTHCSYSTTSRSGSDLVSVSMTISYTFPRSIIASIVDQTGRKADAMVAALVRPGMGDYEKELALHDALVEAASYDSVALATGRDGPGTHTPYGVLFEGKGVCDSYSKAFFMLAAKAGLECLIVQGSAEEGSHSWNLVKIGGSWYHLDVTYDDPVGPVKVLSHDYFNLPDGLIAANHSWDRGSVPVCSSTEANWFEAGKLVVEDFAALRASLETAFARRETPIYRRLRSFDPASFGAELRSAISAAESKAPFRGIDYSFNQGVGALRLDVKYR